MIQTTTPRTFAHFAAEISARYAADVLNAGTQQAVADAWAGGERWEILSEIEENVHEALRAIAPELDFTLVERAMDAIVASWITMGVVR